MMLSNFNEHSLELLSFYRFSYLVVWLSVVVNMHFHRNDDKNGLDEIVEDGKKILKQERRKLSSKPIVILSISGLSRYCLLFLLLVSFTTDLTKWTVNVYKSAEGLANNCIF